MSTMIEALVNVALMTEGHKISAYGQGSYDGDFCKSCGWQGPPRSGADHERQTRREALTDVFTTTISIYKE